MPGLASNFSSAPSFASYSSRPMSGLEAIGIVASLAQLVQYSAKLIRILQEICQNDLRSAKRYQHHKQQVQQVLEIAELIKATEGLQSKLLLSHVDALTETTKSIEGAIQTTLYFSGPASKLKKCLRVLDVSKADSTIFQGFDDLERDKSSLTLCLLGKFGSLILDIRSNVGQMSVLRDQIDTMQRSLQDCAKIAEESKRIKEETALSSGHDLCECKRRDMHRPVCPELVQIGACAVQPDTLPLRREWSLSGDGSYSSDTTLMDESCTAGASSSAEGSIDGRSSAGFYDEELTHSSDDRRCFYSGIRAYDQASQINGSFGFDASDSPRGRSSWVNICAAGKSNQWNGDIKDAALLSGFFSRH